MSWQIPLQTASYRGVDFEENWQAFEGVERIAVQTSVSYSGKYEDNLVYKF